VRGADRKLDADQAACDQTPEDLAPERLGLRGADVQADDHPPANLVAGVRDDDELARDAPAVTDLLDSASTNRLGSGPSSGRSRNACTCLSQRPAFRLTRTRTSQTERLNELVDAPRRHAAHIRLLHDADELLPLRLRGSKHDRK
jgi:hypothetical protein